MPCSACVSRCNCIGCVTGSIYWTFGGPPVRSFPFSSCARSCWWHAPACSSCLPWMRPPSSVLPPHLQPSLPSRLRHPVLASPHLHKRTPPRTHINLLHLYATRHPDELPHHWLGACSPPTEREREKEKERERKHQSLHSRDSPPVRKRAYTCLHVQPPPPPPHPHPNTHTHSPPRTHMPTLYSQTHNHQSPQCTAILMN
jgi:hypothetical protein